ncbi:MAG: alkaline phosphatase family protein [Clostridia bacterium]|nr:alkaline phosphatase family protein [Clostridia bacterium]
MTERKSLDTLCAALAHAMKVEKPAEANTANPDLIAYIDERFGEAGADRLFMYNPDAIGEWVYHKYPQLLSEMISHTDMEVNFETVMPSVTPVCFGTMYTGAQPAVHGIRKYEKPVIKIDTLFDAMIRSGKKCAIVADMDCSMGKIFLEREMDYFYFRTIEEINAKAVELILADQYDFIAVYHANYDAIMHKHGPESIEALSALNANSHAFAMFSELIKNNWKGHNTLVGFAMDHGCHEIDGGCGSHGLDMDEDLHIAHRFQAYIAE